MNLQKYFGASLIFLGLAIGLAGLGTFLNQFVINPQVLYYLMFTWIDLLLAMAVAGGLVWLGFDCAGKRKKSGF